MGAVIEKFDPLDLLANMLFADQEKTDWVAAGGRRVSDTGAVYEEVDAGSRLKLESMRPSVAHTFDMVDDDRLLAATSDYLLRHPAETLGERAEVVMMTSDRVKWSGFRRLRNTPRGVWLGAARPVLYELHYREVLQSGYSVYQQRVAALDKSGRPVPVVIIGSRGAPGQLGNAEAQQLIMAASVIEDCHRAGAIRCTLTDCNTLIAPIPNGAQKALFALRDGPHTGKGRKRAILHYVMRHARKSTQGNEHAVSEHFRGVTQFTFDGMSVTLAANEAAR